MAISTFPVAAAGGGRTDEVYANGVHTVNISAGYYILEVTGAVNSNNGSLSSGFQKLASTTSLEIGIPGGSWNSQSTGFTKDFLEPVYNDDFWVVATENTGSGQVLTSPDSINWTARTTPSTNWMLGAGTNGLTTGDDKYVLGGVSGDVLTSSDGITWTLRTSNISGTINAFLYTGSLWVAVASNGDVTTSPDGITWTSQTSGTTENLNDIAYNGTTMIIAGDNGTLLKSTDGVTFTSVSAPDTYDLNSATFGNGLFVVGGTEGRVITSSDGDTWTETDTGLGSFLNLDAAAFGDGVYAVGGNDGRLATSVDATTWTTQSTGTSENLNGMYFGDGKFLAVGQVGTITTSEGNSNSGLLITSLPAAIEA